MKLIAYTIFVVSVLLMSGFAKADMLSPFMQQHQMLTAIPVDEVSVDSDSLQLLLEGHLPNPCYQEPTATLSFDTKESNTLILRLSSPLPMEMCVDRTQPYSTVVDLRSLVQAAQLPLNEKTPYVIKTEGNAFALQVSGAELLN